MIRVAHLDCVGGIAGDMVIAALLDAGADRELLDGLAARLRLPEAVGVRVTRVERQGVGALHVAFPVGAGPASPRAASHDHAHDHGDHPHRAWREIRELLAGADLPEPIRGGALAVFGLLADAEARVHGVPPDEVHFHELGAVDTLMDVCGALLLLEALGVERVTVSPLPVGHGTGRAAHGVLPLPSPATLEILARAGAPIRGVDLAGETVTPTGAALAAHLAAGFGSTPAMTLERVGTGAGSRDREAWPNVLRVLVGTAAAPRAPVSLIETNLDDLSPELVPDAAARATAAGALDVWTTPAQMKKGRPGFVLSALARPADEDAVARALLEETSALGVRIHRLDRVELDREWRSVDVGGHAVRVKVGLLAGRVVNLAPEHDDCAAAAAATGRTVKSVWAEALAAAGRDA